jgi:hypothetical protein
MEKPTKQTWLTKFGELPLVIKIILIWMYVVSAGYWLSFIVKFVNSKGTVELSALGAGYLFWWIANGLINKNNFFRMAALFSGGVGSILSFLAISEILRPGSDGINYSITLGPFHHEPSESIVFMTWVTVALMNVFMIVALLLPQSRKLFVKSAPAQVN